MRMLVPITGRVKDFNEKRAKLDGVGVSGYDDDPIQLININLGNVSWKLISIDLETDEAEIEVTAATHVGIGDPKNGGYARLTTPEEKIQLLADAQNMITGKSKDQLYAETGSPKLKKLKKHVDDYKKYKAEMTA